MDKLTIRICGQGEVLPCCQCGQPAFQRPGPGLFLADTGEPVCKPCGKKLDPNLAALVDLAGVAEKVGGVCRHLLTPPMEALLALAQAAEQYTHCSANQKPRPALHR